MPFLYYIQYCYNNSYHYHNRVAARSHYSKKTGEIDINACIDIDVLSNEIPKVSSSTNYSKRVAQTVGSMENRTMQPNN